MAQNPDTATDDSAAAAQQAAPATATPAARKSTSRRKWTRSEKLALGSLVVSLVALGTAAPPAISWIHDQVTRLTVSIAHPPQGWRVGDARPQVDGNAENVPLGQNLWLVVSSVGKGTYYPVEQLVVQQNGSWAVSTQHDIMPSAPGEYDITVYLTNSKADVLFRGYLDAHNQTATTAAGMPSLPDGVTPEKDVVVTRL